MEENLSSVRAGQIERNELFSNPLASQINANQYNQKTNSEDFEDFIKGGFKSGRALESKIQKMSSIKQGGLHHDGQFLQHKGDSLSNNNELNMNVNDVALSSGEKDKFLSDS